MMTTGHHAPQKDGTVSPMLQFHCFRIYSFCPETQVFAVNYASWKGEPHSFSSQPRPYLALQP